MTIARASIGCEHLDIAVDISGGVCSLPAVATQDWCSKAADAVRRIRSGSVSAACLAALGQRGSIIQLEASGAAGHDPFGRTLEGEIIHPEHSSTLDWWFEDAAPRSGHNAHAYAAEPSSNPVSATHAAHATPHFASPQLSAHQLTTPQLATPQLAGTGAGHHAPASSLAPGAVAPASASNAAHAGVRVALLRDLPCSERWSETSCGRRWAKLGIVDLIVALAPMPGTMPGRVFVVEVGVGNGQRPLTEADCGVLRSIMGQLTARATLAFGTETSSALTRLTQREQQVLEHLALGKSVKQIATDLARSPHTVHDHVKSLHRKLNASSRGELIARALGHLAACSRRPRVTLRAGSFDPTPTVVAKLPALMTA